MYLAIAGVAKRAKEEGVKSNGYRGLIRLINTESFIKLRFFFDGKVSLSATLFLMKTHSTSRLTYFPLMMYLSRALHHGSLGIIGILFLIPAEIMLRSAFLC